MKAWSKTSVIEQYISSCAVIEVATSTGAYMRSNKEQARLISAYKWLEKNIPEANEVLGELLLNNSSIVQTKAAVHCLCLNIKKTEAINTLEIVSKRTDIWGFNAKKVLETYYKNGFLKVY